VKLEAIRPVRGSDRLTLPRWDSSNGADDPRFCDISIKPFRHEQVGYMFGLLLDETEDDEDVASATLWPNDIMFHAPWDGEYST
jgi:hypothetical protein